MKTAKLHKKNLPSLSALLAFAVFAVAIAGCGGDGSEDQSKVGLPPSDIVRTTGRTGAIDRAVQAISASAERAFAACQKSAAAIKDEQQLSQALAKCETRHDLYEAIAKKRIQQLRHAQQADTP